MYDCGKRLSKHLCLSLVGVISCVSALVNLSGLTPLTPHLVAEVSAEPLKASAGATAQQADPRIDDVARWISGLKPRGETIPAKLIKSKRWLRHARALDKLWEQSMTPVLTEMHQWSSQRLDERDHRPVFYPFSGPDILNALSLFPHSHDYLMIALESEGVIPPTPTKLDQETRKGLRVLRDYIVGHVTRNFFITYEMGGKQKQAALGEHTYTGVTSVMLFFLVRTGHQILSARMIKITDQGKVVAASDPQGGNVTGAEITFRASAEADKAAGPVKRAIFLRANINDVKIHQERGLIALILSYGQYNTIVKAASYLMHLQVFDDIRSLILSRSLNIITDDTGVPYHFFKEDPKLWSVKLYGRYTRPNPGSKSFAKHCQPDLREAITREGEGELPFKFGYYLAKPNLIFATRRAPIVEPIFDRSGSHGISSRYRGNVECTKGKQVILRRPKRD